MDTIYVMGGDQKDDLQNQDEWHIHRAGILARIDLRSKTATKLVEYSSPPDCCPVDDPSFLFKAATFHNGRLYACTSTEVLIYDFPALTLERRISHPCFNDIHHVTVADDGRLYVANTGLDSVVEMAADGAILRHWSVAPDHPQVWDRFSPDVDYRRIATTKPHYSHPNYVFFLDGEIWATRCKQRDAVCLTRPGERFQVGQDQPIHDGIVTPYGIWFTQVDGHLIHVDRHTRQVRKVHDLGAMLSSVRKPGWCRGLHMLDERRALVGFTRLRPTRWQGNVNWLKLNELKLLYRMPARVCLFDLAEQRIERDVSLQDFGMTTVFSIHTESEIAASRIAA